MNTFGLGMRRPHYADFLSGSADVDFVEVISENFMVPGGQPLRTLRKVRESYSVALHGVSLSVGSAHGLDRDYLRKLRILVDDIEPMLVSDHLCWTRVPGFSSHDLLPLPYTQEALSVVCANVEQAQDALGRQILLENPSAYLAYPQSVLPEWAFLAELCDRTGCGLLLDVNNLFVSASNLAFDATECIAQLPMKYVRQIHLAGHSQGKHLLIDTHDQPVADPVWALFDLVMERVESVPVMIERDDRIPGIEVLLDELAIARSRAAGSGQA